MLLNWPQIEDSLRADFGSGFRLRQAVPVSRGDINLAFRLVTNQELYFIKLNTPDRLAMFEAERAGLVELARCDALAVPKPLAVGCNADAAYLCLSWLDFSAQTDQTALGEAVARLHQIKGKQFGWWANNFIGTSVQHNQYTDNWADFFWTMRLQPQLLQMVQAGSSFSELALQPLERAVRSLLGGRDYMPCLVHGDLWHGNAGSTVAGAPCLFDPAPYWGHAETDIAMAQLFGGFTPAFFAAYHALCPPEEGADERRLVYQLYHLLNHYNLFGGSYLDRCTATIAKIIAL
ncbi:MAG: fructosamine kinase family protein [Cellvibrionales bacterium]|nr:fructosamine kinase family protein [Cellvibrionales bacterium]